MIWRLYKIVGPGDRVYIGQTTKTLEQRWKKHCSAFSKCIALKRAIQKYGPAAFSIVQLATCETQLSADELEKRLISEYQSLTTQKGYNIVVGGMGHALTHCKRGHELTQETQTINGHCKKCKNAAAKQSLTNNPELAEQRRAQCRKNAQKRRLESPELFRERCRAYSRSERGKEVRKRLNRIRTFKNRVGRAAIASFDAWLFQPGSAPS
jgi:group I intron endonuclease